MSKNKSILDFFSKSPSVQKSSPVNNSKTPKPEDKSMNGTPKTTSKNLSSSKIKNIPKPKRRTFDEDEDDSDCENKIENSSKSKRRRIVIASESDDSADDYKPAKEEESSEGEESMHSDVSEEETPKKKRKVSKKTESLSAAKSQNSKESPLLTKFGSPKFNGKKTESSPQAANSTPKRTSIADKNSSINGTPNSNASEEISEEYAKEWLHETLDWLQDDKIKDKYGKRKTDPDYNPRTLYIPETFKKNLTPAMKQWWDLKVDHFDTILFFKVGKFYEFYHMDAVVGVKELGLSFMKGDFAHSGFPEIAYGRFSECLVKKGYKVARVEQTETPQMMEERVKKLHRPTKFDKVVAREICQVTTRGTRTLNYQDEPMGANNNFLLAICEKYNRVVDSDSEYGICFVDTCIGKFTLAQFHDDRFASKLMTLIALYPPVEVLYERSSLSKKTHQLLNNNLSNVPKEALNSGSQFWDCSKVLKFLSEGGYFSCEQNQVQWPETIKNMLDPDDRLDQTCKKEYELALKSLGACIWYLKDCCIEDNVLSMKLFEEYKPVEGLAIEKPKENAFSDTHMVLDGVALANLEIVPVRPSDNSDGTLLGTMDFCSTHFGKRLLRHWLCSPLCNPDSITDRLNAIEDLLEIPNVVSNVSSKLKTLPDLERFLSKIHSQGIARSKDHPESRAVYYDAVIYNRRKLNDFLSTLNGFRESIDIIAEFEKHTDDFKSKLLKECVSSSKDGGRFPDLGDIIKYFDDAFDHNVAKKEGNIIPNTGVDADYDSASAELEELEDELEKYLNKMSSKLGCKVSYVGSGRTRYQLEVAESRKVPENFDFQSARKGYRRYYSPEGREFASRVLAAEETRDAALRDVSRRIFEQFSKNYTTWKNAVHCLSVIDVLISLCTYYKQSEVEMCRPEFILPDENTEPFLEIIDGRHPTYLKYFTGDTYIPNSVYLGPKKEVESEEINGGGRVVLVTGPNMGGKSTLMRQAGAIVIMAHVGSFVPASSVKLTPVDRIFTRIGASDQISRGESTFFVEASETSCILHHATSNSFVLVDELGRGTATHDGTAIASSVLEYLANEIKCRTLFSTHYHSLVEDFRLHPFVGLGHMSCMVEKDSACPELERITFLYKFVDGPCPKSYGFNVALLAKIPKEIVQEASAKAQEMENRAKISKYLTKLLSHMSAEELVQEINQSLKISSR